MADNIGSATAISGWSGSTTGDNTGYTLESGEAAVMDANQFGTHYGGGRSDWFAWTAPATGVVRFATSANGTAIGDTILAAIDGNVFATATLLAWNDDFSGLGLYSRIEFNVTSGQVYYISVDGFNGDYVDDPVYLITNTSEGGYTLTWSQVIVSSDNFVNATIITGTTGSISGDNTGFTTETSDPLLAYASSSHTAWYKWTCPSTGYYDFWTEASGGTLGDSVLGVYSGSALGSLTIIGENDDTLTSIRTSGVKSELNSLHLFSGVEYHIEVGGYSNAFGTYILHWDTGATPPPPPVNDNFIDATSISGASGSIAGDNTDSTFETNDPLHAAFNFFVNRTVWYKWTCPTSGYYDFWTSAPGTLDTVLGIYSGSALGALLRGGTNDNTTGTHTTGNYSEIDQLYYTSGVEYHIEVGGAGATVVGAFTLNWATGTTPASPPANDAFANATLLTGSTVTTTTGTTVDATVEFGEPAPYTSDRSVWYKWVAPYTALTGFDFTGTSFSVYSGTSLSALTLVTSGNSGRIIFNAVSGTTYYIRVYGGTGAAISVALDMASTTPPANDLQANATEIGTGLTMTNPVKGTINQSLSGATVTGGETLPNGQIVSVWFKFTLLRKGMFSLQIMSGNPLAMYVELTGPGGVVQTWYYTSPTSESVFLNPGTYYVRIAANDWKPNIRIRYRISYTSMQVKVGVINVGDTTINTGFGRKASAVMLFGTGLASDTPMQNDGQWGIGCSDSLLNQWAGSAAKKYQGTFYPAIFPYTFAQAQDVTSGYVFRMIDPDGAITQAASVTAFNDNGSINLSWSASSQAGKIGYFAIVDVEVHVETQVFNGSANLAPITTDWLVKSYFTASYYNTSQGADSHYPNQGFGFSRWGAFGQRTASPSGDPDLADDLTFMNTGNGPYIDGGSSSETFSPNFNNADDSVTSWTHFNDAGVRSVSTTLGIILFGGLGFSTIDAGQGGNPPTPPTYPYTFNIAGAIGGTVWEELYWPIAGVAGGPGHNATGTNPTMMVTTSAYDINNNQFVMMYGIRSFQNTVGDNPFVNAVWVAWRGFYSNKIAYAMKDFNYVNWSAVETVTTLTRGSIETGSAEFFQGPPRFTIFGIFGGNLIPTIIPIVSFSSIRQEELRTVN